MTNLHHHKAQGLLNLLIECKAFLQDCPCLNNYDLLDRITRTIDQIEERKSKNSTLTQSQESHHGVHYQHTNHGAHLPLVVD